MLSMASTLLLAIKGKRRIPMLYKMSATTNLRPMTRFFYHTKDKSQQLNNITNTVERGMDELDQFYTCPALWFGGCKRNFAKHYITNHWRHHFVIAKNDFTDYLLPQICFFPLKLFLDKLIKNFSFLLLRGYGIITTCSPLHLRLPSSNFFCSKLDLFILNHQQTFEQSQIKG